MFNEIKPNKIITRVTNKQELGGGVMSLGLAVSGKDIGTCLDQKVIVRRWHFSKRVD